MESHDEPDDPLPEPPPPRRLAPHLQFLEVDFLKPTRRNPNALNAERADEAIR